jgi:hypothetical protein
MPDLDDGTITRMAQGIIKFGYTKQIQIDSTDVERCLEIIKARARKQSVVYLPHGVNLFIDSDMWSTDVDEWRTFLAAREKKPRVTPKKAGVSPAG